MYSAPLSTTALLVGWATGGIIFGILGDRIGRAKTLTIMIICYSLSTGLCGLSVGPWDYIFYCFITGMGAGRHLSHRLYACGRSLPDRARTPALGTVQVFSAVGNMGAGFISLGFVALAGKRHDFNALALDVQRRHPALAFGGHRCPADAEPDAWKRAVAAGTAKKAGLGELFADPRWRRTRSSAC